MTEMIVLLNSACIKYAACNLLKHIILLAYLIHFSSLLRFGKKKETWTNSISFQSRVHSVQRKQAKIPLRSRASNGCCLNSHLWNKPPFFCPCAQYNGRSKSRRAQSDAKNSKFVAFLSHDRGGARNLKRRRRRKGITRIYIMCPIHTIHEREKLFKWIENFVEFFSSAGPLKRQPIIFILGRLLFFLSIYIDDMLLNIRVEAAPFSSLIVGMR